MLETIPGFAPAQTEKPTSTQILTALSAERMRRSFVLFCQRAHSEIIPQKQVWNWHLSAIAEHLVYVTQGEIRFLMICLPPRHQKSTLLSVLWPVWHWLQKPETQFLSASVDERLALRDSRLSRRLIESPWFNRHYPGEIQLLEDENQARLYKNTANGARAIASTRGRVVGDGGDIQIGDDFHDAAKVEHDKVRQSSLDWHDNQWRSRVNNPNTSQKVYAGQRTHSSDIYGHVLEQEGHRWVKLILPLEFDTKRICVTYPNDGTGVKAGAPQIFRDPRQEEGELLHPRHFNAQTAAAERDIMSTRAWNAQYQQQPEGSGGLILKRAWWKQWCWPEWHPQAGQERPLPAFTEIIQSWDTAFEADEENDFSARTTWGLFINEEPHRDPATGRITTSEPRTCALLLDWFEDRIEYPSLRDEAIRSFNEYAPDRILIEKKASGHSLIQELRKKSLPVKGFLLKDGGDLTARVHTASLMLEKGCIYYVPRKWSFKLIEQVAKFPSGDHDDTESSLAMAWQYMRRYHDLTLPDDEEKKDIAPFAWQKAKYG